MWFRSGAVNCFLALCFFLILGCGDGSDSNANNKAQGAQVPEGALKASEVINNRYAPDNFLAVLGWAQIATLSKNQIGKPASVSVDYMRLIEVDPTAGTNVLTEENYDIETLQGLTIDEGALFDRTPTWFANDNHHIPLTSSSIRAGFLTIDASSAPNNIAHWWTKRKKCKPAATYYVEMRVKITGKVGLQIGGDFWRDEDVLWVKGNANNPEYFASDWYGDTKGEYITIRAPHF